MKKLVTLITILLLMLVTLAGCTETQNNTTNSSNGAKNNTTNTTSKSNNTSSSNKTNTSNNSNTVDISKYDFASAAKAQVANPEKGETIAIMHIKDYGDIKIKFFDKVAPKAVENFIKLSEQGYYNGVTFHRVVKDFMIQGGDPTATGRGGESIWGKKFEDEFDLSVAPYRGALCMANSGTNTNGSQFFIEQARYNENTYNLLKNNGYPDNLLQVYKTYGGSMHLFYVHTVFGQVIEGMDVVDKIAACETDSANDKPVNDVVIESISIEKY